MYILGLSCYYHDSAACLLKDGQVVCASAEERLSRIKHDPSFPQKAIAYCLEHEGISGKDLEYVVFHEKPFLKFERLIKSIISTYPRSYGLFREAAVSWLKEKLWIKARIAEILDIPLEKIIFSEHHLSHAASAFFCSPFQDAAILTCDGVGEWTTASLGCAKAKWGHDGENKINLFREVKFPHSLGLLYSVFTAFLGFQINEGEFKVMGMSAFGEPKYTEKIYKLIRVNDDGSFKMDMKYFSYHYHPAKSFNRNFEELFGRPRDPRSRFYTRKTSFNNHVDQPADEELEKNQYYADIAASIQKVIEDILLKIARHLHRITGAKRLCFSGGVALNCLANSRILKETPFEEIFIQPASGDAGASMGAALYVWHCLLQKPRSFVLDHVYWGREFTNLQIEGFLRENNLKYEYIADQKRLLDVVAGNLAEQKVVGWFQGRGEWGPRSLGNRSILADPRREEMKDIVNIKIKFREPFRPFAAAVLSDHADEFFEFAKAAGQYPTRFMLLTLPVKKSGLIPAVTHLDGSSRIQVVDKDTNLSFYNLIERFYRITGVPVVLNTSFNLNGEPIVDSPADAYNTFLKSGIDVLVMGDYIIKK
jgi:carbamoyltransferase